MDLRLQLRLREDQRRVSDLSALPLIQAACGVLRGADGSILLTQRPAGKIAAGKWEFPGGKIEAGEDAREALARELHEELAIDVRACRPLLHFCHAYSDRIVFLHTRLVTAWEGQLEAREQQALRWLRAEEAMGLDCLPTVAPILQSLALPEDYVFTPDRADERMIRDGLPRLPRGALLRLRLPLLDDPAYARLARSLRADVAALGLRLVTDRGIALAHEVDAHGLHLREQELMSLHRHTLSSRPCNPPLLTFASCHDAASLAQAAAIACDAAVLGAVCATPSHPAREPIGWQRFAACVADLKLPVYAIGGLGPADKPTAFDHQAQGIAGISAYWSRSSS